MYGLAHKTVAFARETIWFKTGKFTISALHLTVQLTTLLKTFLFTTGKNYQTTLDFTE